MTIDKSKGMGLTAHPLYYVGFTVWDEWLRVAQPNGGIGVCRVEELFAYVRG